MKTKVIDLKIYLDQDTKQVTSELMMRTNKETMIQLLEEYIEYCKNEDLPKC